MSEKVVETLATVGVTFLGSMIIMIIGETLRAWREDGRIVDERGYEWLKDRLDRLDEYISPLGLVSYEMKAAALGLLDWTLRRRQTPGPERTLWLWEVSVYLEDLKKALPKAHLMYKERPEILLGSLEPQISRAVYGLNASFARLLVVCDTLLDDRVPAESHGLASLERWQKKWHDEVENEHATFEKAYGVVVDGMRRALTLRSGYPPPSLLERLRKALFSKEDWKYWLGLAVMIIVIFVGWAIARGIIRLPLGG